jgi:hypothetical protein
MVNVLSPCFWRPSATRHYTLVVGVGRGRLGVKLKFLTKNDYPESLTLNHKPCLSSLKYLCLPSVTGVSLKGYPQNWEGTSPGEEMEILGRRCERCRCV